MPVEGAALDVDGAADGSSCVGAARSRPGSLLTTCTSHPFRQLVIVQPRPCSWDKFLPQFFPHLFPEVYQGFSGQLRGDAWYKAAQVWG